MPMSNIAFRPSMIALATGIRALFRTETCLSRKPLSFWNDQRGTIAVMTGLCATAIVGFTALAIDVGSWQVAQRSMQGAADMAAYSAGIAYNDGTSSVTEAERITA